MLAGESQVRRKSVWWCLLVSSAGTVSSVSHYRPPRTLVLVDALSELGGQRLVLDDEGRWTVVDVHRGQRSTYKCLTLVLSSTTVLPKILASTVFPRL